MTKHLSRTHPPTEVLANVAAQYRESIAFSFAAKQYLQTRGVTEGHLLPKLGIGFADGSLAAQAPPDSEARAALIDLGLLTTNGKELLQGCIVIPLRDARSTTVGLYGRSIESDVDLYAPLPPRGLILPEMSSARELIVTASVFDVLSFHEAGIRNTTCVVNGTGWSADHDALIEQQRIRRVILAFETNGAGQRGCAELKDMLTSRGLDVAVVQLPASSANELLVREGAERFAAIWRDLLARSATAASRKEPEISVEGDGAYRIDFGLRRYRIRGLAAVGATRMRVNVRGRGGCPVPCRYARSLLGAEPPRLRRVGG
jgi:DNA primase